MRSDALTPREMLWRSLLLTLFALAVLDLSPVVNATHAGSSETVVALAATPR